MLKTPAALLGLFRGDEMYVLKPQQHGHGNPSIRLDIPNPYTFVSDSLVEMVPIESSSYDGYVYLHYPNGEKVTFYISKYTPKPWPDLFMVPAGTKMSYTGRRHPLKSLRIYPLVPAKSVGGGRQHIDGSLRSTAWHPAGYGVYIVGDGRTITRTNPITLNAPIMETFILRYRKSTSGMADKIVGGISLSDRSFGVIKEKNYLVVTALPAVAFVVLQ